MSEQHADEVAPAATTGDRVEVSDAEWRQRLTPEQFAVLRQKGTERPYTGEYEHPVFAGTFVCAGCGQSLFAADDQFDSGSGWPSFVRPIDPGAVVLETDRTFGMRRVEVTCSRCGGHLGHVFEDGPRPTGERWCINSVSLVLDPAKP
jgi:peptide-methionine (R)-S-oxide reductase